ncbi:MAG: RidA family protein, partial [Hyphomicrobiaceae bacterium]|nr:RidA family protein [Hyphomicrobiaceae bacterium]
MALKRIQVGPRMSQAVVHGDTVYLAGQVAFDAPGGSVTDQTKNILDRIDALLGEAGTSKSNLI